ncbi:MAG: hypothetical protein LBG58_01525 [Planctomycetaceae bacterium]|nr:hypothetical protein [Planctomycetaceae bacterium]
MRENRKPFINRKFVTVHALTKPITAGNQKAKRLATQIAVRTQGQVGYRRRDVSAKHRLPLDF